MTVTAAPPERFDMGRVISAGFALLARRPLPIVLLALLLSYLPAVVVGLATQHLAGPTPQPGASPDLAATFQRLGVLEGIAFVAAGFNWILRGGVAIVATSDAAGRGDVRSQLAMLATGAPLIFIAGVVAALAVGLGTLLLIVPGILLSLAWALCPAVAAIEGKGFMDIFRRSTELTRGHRGALFGILLLLGIAGGVLTFGLRLAAGVPMLATGAALPPLFTFVLQPALSAVFTAITASVYAAAYLELRGVKEGFAAGGAASVFD